MKKLSISAVVLLVALGGARAATAQPPRTEEIPGWSFVPGLQSAGIYENNLLFASSSPTDGSYLTLTPSLETRFRSPVGTFNAGYSFTGERHGPRLRSLDDTFARQLGVMSFDARPSTRSSVTGMVRYMTTRRPEEVLDATGLIAGQRKTTSLAASFGVDKSMSLRSRVRFAYSVGIDDYGRASDARPGARNTLQTLALGVPFQASPRTSVTVEYTGKFLIGDEYGAEVVTHGVFWANTLGVRVARSLTPRLTAAVTIGPRAAQVVPPVIERTDTTPVHWEVAPEVLASLSYRGTRLALSSAYARTQLLGVGASGLVNTESLEVSLGAAVSRLRMSARPGIYRNSLAGQRADSYRFDGTAGVVVSSWTTVDFVYGYRHQDRSLALADFAVTAAARSRTRNRFVVGMTVRRPFGM
jgi:hypothetical protein